MSFLQRISLKKKLFWGFFLSSIIIIIVGGAGVLNINNTNNSIGVIADEDIPLLVNSEKLNIYALTHRRYEKDFFLNIGKEEKQRGYLKKFEAISEKTAKTLSEAIDLAEKNPLVEAEVRNALESSRNAYGKYKQGFLALAERVFATPDITPQQANKLMKPIKNDIYAFEDGIKKAVAASEKIIDSSTTKLVEQGGSSRLVILLFLVGGVILSLGLSYIISNSIVRSVNSVADGLKDIAEGDADLTMRLPVYCDDEIGEQAKWFNTFIEKMQSLIKDVAGGVNVLSTSSSELSSVSTKLSNHASDALERSTAGSAATEQMSSSMTTISSAMEESSSNISMVATATEEMTSTVTEIAQNAAVAKGITEGAVEKSAQTTEKMNNLGDAATKISKVTEAITEISEQTNLLALNATIEAARAGEVGKGFAVVANEIKELARQTAEATVDIKNQIENIQDTTSGTITDIQEISSVINEINEVITTIAAAVEQQSSATQEIAENIAQTSSGVSEVHEHVSQVSVTSDEINGEITEISSGADEINRDSTEVSQSAEELMRLSDQLSNLIKRFKVA